MVVSRRTLFLTSVFFVVGFSLVFSLVGVLLQSVFSFVSYDVQQWLGRIGGVIIVVFALHLLGVFRFAFLNREFKITPRLRFSNSYVTAFVFGAAFAVGWTPCIGPVLG